ncbi:hypothetical protein HQ533_05315 [Candidatus Woesearchaeota archaeon]|nr:hypothetical protein [Candidatus Woesearchaeota archaeon]
MCFAPYVSLSTFVIEFLLALFFLFRNPKDKFNRIIALISFLLGFYQLNEFLICVTSVNFFTRFAMAITAILPALGISFALMVWRKKLRYYWNLLIYSPAVFFILMFFLTGYYKESAVCNSVFLQYPNSGLLGQFFELYYIIYVLGVIILFYFRSTTIKAKYEKRLLYLGMLGMFVFTVPSYVFILFLPSMEVQFPSILCEFALLSVIVLIIMMWYKEKHNIKY